MGCKDKNVLLCQKSMLLVDKFVDIPPLSNSFLLNVTAAHIRLFKRPWNIYEKAFKNYAGNPYSDAQRKQIMMQGSWLCHEKRVVGVSGFERSQAVFCWIDEVWRFFLNQSPKHYFTNYSPMHTKHQMFFKPTVFSLCCSTKGLAQVEGAMFFKSWFLKFPVCQQQGVGSWLQAERGPRNS